MITLRSSTWVVVVGVVLLLLFIIFGIVSPEPVEAWYYRTQVAPELHEDLGFVAEVRQANPCCPETRLTIVHVAPGGLFDRAGIKVGDIPWDTHGRQEITFYRRLENARGEAADLPLIRPGGSTGRGDIPLMMRFKVAVPGKRRSNSA